MSQQIFDSVKYTKPGRSTFDLSHDIKMSLKFGLIYPIMCEETAPGDKFRIGCESLIRFAPMIAPTIHRINATMHYFAVPMRLLWPNFMKWYKGEKDPLTDLPYVHPYFNLEHDGSNWTPLMDYLGIPNPAQNPGVSVSVTKLNVMQLAAYIFIWNEFYRDQNLQQKIDFELVDGNNDALVANFTLKRRAWMHDYFTSALPFAQKGDPVNIPIDGTVTLDPATTDPGTFRKASDHTTVSSQDVVQSVFAQTAADPAGYPLVYDPQDTLVVHNANATLNDLRIAMRVQEWLEKSARGGTRDNEFIRAQFGVRTSDARLQRPEYITGIKTPVVISEVLNTTGTTDAPQGAMAGHGVSVVSGNYGTYYSEEPCFIIGMMNVQPDTAYFQGIPKQFLKIDDPTQKLFPVFGNLGEQAIERREVYAYTANGLQTFGYTPRYSEYKYANNRVAGDMRSSLLFWHQARKFDSEPALNEAFIAADPPTRIFAVDDGTDYLWSHVYNKVSASRLLPFYGTPTF